MAGRQRTPRRQRQPVRNGNRGRTIRLGCGLGDSALSRGHPVWGGYVTLKLCQSSMAWYRRGLGAVRISVTTWLGSCSARISLDIGNESAPSAFLPDATRQGCHQPDFRSFPRQVENCEQSLEILTLGVVLLGVLAGAVWGWLTTLPKKK